MIAIFARANHPPGYGYAPREGEAGGRAHGYVVLLVRCSSTRVLDAVKDKLAAGFEGFPAEGSAPQYSDGVLGQWYGGQFDYLCATFEDESYPQIEGLSQAFSSRGDNRFVGIYEAAEVLAA